MIIATLSLARDTVVFWALFKERCIELRLIYGLNEVKHAIADLC